MEAPEHRKWMDTRIGPNKEITNEFIAGVFEFIEFAFAQEQYKLEGKLRCPCKKCNCRQYHEANDVKVHLCKKGFMPNYYYWTNHGELMPSIPLIVFDNLYYGDSGLKEDYNRYEQMVMDAAGPLIGTYIEQQRFDLGEQMEEDPNLKAKQFFDMLAAQAPLYNGCENYSELLAAVEAPSIKFDFNNSRNCFNRWMAFMGNALPKDNRMLTNFYHAKKSVERLGLGCVKIDCCPNGCMIYYPPEENMQNCKFCGEENYKKIIRNGKAKQTPFKVVFPTSPKTAKTLFLNTNSTSNEMV